MAASAFRILTWVVALMAWTFIAASFVVALGAINADASVIPKSDRLTAAPEKAVERNLPKTRCLKLQTVIVVRKLADGMVFIAPVQAWVPCK